MELVIYCKIPTIKIIVGLKLNARWPSKPNWATEPSKLFFGARPMAN